MTFVRIALYLALALIGILLGGATWVGTMWGVGPAAMAPLYLVGLVIAAGLVFSACRIGKTPHA